MFYHTNICTLECFVRYLTFYLVVHISSYAKLNHDILLSTNDVWLLFQDF